MFIWCLRRALYISTSFICWTGFSITLFGQLGQPERLVFNVVGPNEPFAITMAIEIGDTRRAATVRLVTSTGLHRATGLEARNAIRRHSFVVQLAVEQMSPVGVMSRKIQEVDTGEDNQESAQKGDGVDSIGGVKAFE